MSARRTPTSAKYAPRVASFWPIFWKVWANFGRIWSSLAHLDNRLGPTNSTGKRTSAATPAPGPSGPATADASETTATTRYRPNPGATSTISSSSFDLTTDPHPPGSPPRSKGTLRRLSRSALRNIAPRPLGVVGVAQAGKSVARPGGSRQRGAAEASTPRSCARSGTAARAGDGSGWEGPPGRLVGWSSGWGPGVGAGVREGAGEKR